MVGEVCGERSAVSDRSGLRFGGRSVHSGHNWNSRTFTTRVIIEALYVESGGCHDGSGEVETYEQGIVGDLVGIPTAGGSRFIQDCREGHGSGTAARNRSHFRFRRNRIDSDLHGCPIALTARVGIVAGSVDGGAFGERILEAVGGHEGDGVVFVRIPSTNGAVSAGRAVQGDAFFTAVRDTGGGDVRKAGLRVDDKGQRDGAVTTSSIGDGENSGSS